MKKRVIVAHPFQQHSYRLATAIDEAGYLYEYITTVFDKKGTLTHYIQLLAKGRLKTRINKKNNKVLENKVTTFCELEGIIYLAMIRIPSIEKARRSLGNHLIRHFGIKVAKYAIKNNADAVVMYDTTAAACFEYLKKHAPHIKRILDMSSNTTDNRLGIYECEYEKDFINQLRKESPIIWNHKINELNTKEILLTDYYLAPSEFVINSISYVGGNPDNAFLLRYGVDSDKFVVSENEKHGPLRLAYTGSVTYSKGIHHLLKVIAQYPKEEVQLYICGRVSNQNDLYQTYRGFPNIKFMGFVSHEELVNIYSECDAFVMPSLAEGFSLSIMEAQACGLPILVSTNTGYAELVKEYHTGFVFDAGNEIAMREVIDLAASSRQKLEQMGINARKLAEIYSWDFYKKNAKIIFDRLLDINT